MNPTPRRARDRSAPRTIVALSVLVTTAGIAGWVIGNALDEGAQHAVLRGGASVSASLFAIGFLSLRRDEPARRRPVWIALGTNHAFHLPLSGRVLLRCSWYVWFVFLVTYLTRARDRPLTSGLAFAALVAVGIARVAVARRNRASEPILTTRTAV